MASNETPSNVEGLATLLVLQDQVKNLNSLKEFGFFTTNETHRLFHFNICYLWQKGDLADITLLAQSEVADIDSQISVNQWMQRLIKYLLSSNKAKELFVHHFESPAKEGDLTLPPELDQTWPSDTPRYILWSPFLNRSEVITGGLIFFRDTLFSAQELKMYAWLARNYQYTWLFLNKQQLFSFRGVKRKKTTLLMSLGVLILLCLPIRLSVTANATVVPKYPALINSPIQGMIKEFLVKPGEQVKAGQLLTVLDKKDFLSTMDINEKKVSLTQAKLRSANNQGYANPDVRSEIPILEAELVVDRAELEYSQYLLSKTDIYSPINGIAVFESKEDWIGQPVSPGENIMTVADPSQVELKIFLPVSELINLTVGSTGKFYPNGQFSEIPVTLSGIGYNADLLPNKILAYRYSAEFSNAQDKPRLGSQGTVRLYGHRVPLIYFIFRKPLHAIRQLLGV